MEDDSALVVDIGAIVKAGKSPYHGGLSHASTSVLTQLAEPDPSSGSIMVDFQPQDDLWALLWCVVGVQVIVGGSISNRAKAALRCRTTRQATIDEFAPVIDALNYDMLYKKLSGILGSHEVVDASQ